MILYCAADLIWATRIKATADSLGVACRPVRNPEMLQARLADCDVRMLIVDLETGPAGIEMIQTLRQQRPAPGVEPPIRIIAFGPHVSHDALRDAKEAGADVVMTRGSFDHRLIEILTSASLSEPR